MLKQPVYVLKVPIFFMRLMALLGKGILQKRNDPILFFSKVSAAYEILLAA